MGTGWKAPIGPGIYRWRQPFGEVQSEDFNVSYTGSFREFLYPSQRGERT